MTDVFMADPVALRCALFVEPNTVGDPIDPSAPRNAPLNNPAAHLAQLYYHSDYDPMEVAIGPHNVTVNHPAIAAGSGSGGAATVNNSRVYGNHRIDQALFDHNFGYVPDFFIAVGSNIVHPGFPVQYDSVDGRARCVTAYATASQIILQEFGVQTSTPMPALSLNYSLLILRRPPAPSGNDLYYFNPATGVLKMARDKFSSDRRYLQIVSGGSPFGLSTGRTIDLKNGTFRSVAPDGSTRAPVPATFRIAFGFGGPTFGPDGNYNGSFAGSPSVLVQAP